MFVCSAYLYLQEKRGKKKERKKERKKEGKRARKKDRRKKERKKKLREETLHLKRTTQKIYIYSLLCDIDVDVS
jgi:ribosomal protein L9